MVEVCLVAAWFSFPAPELLRVENGTCVSVPRGELAGNFGGIRIKAVGVGAVIPHRDGSGGWGRSLEVAGGRDGGKVGYCPQTLWGVRCFRSGIGDPSTGFSLRHGKSARPVLEGLEEEEVLSDGTRPGRPRRRAFLRHRESVWRFHCPWWDVGSQGGG